MQLKMSRSEREASWDVGNQCRNSSVVVADAWVWSAVKSVGREMLILFLFCLLYVIVALAEQPEQS